MDYKTTQSLYYPWQNCLQQEACVRNIENEMPNAPLNDNNPSLNTSFYVFTLFLLIYTRLWSFRKATDRDQRQITIKRYCQQQMMQMFVSKGRRYFWYFPGFSDLTFSSFSKEESEKGGSGSTDCFLYCFFKLCRSRTEFFHIILQYLLLC